MADDFFRAIHARAASASPVIDAVGSSGTVAIVAHPSSIASWRVRWRGYVRVSWVSSVATAGWITGVYGSRTKNARNACAAGRFGVPAPMKRFASARYVVVGDRSTIALFGFLSVVFLEHDAGVFVELNRLGRLSSVVLGCIPEVFEKRIDLLHLSNRVFECD